MSDCLSSLVLCIFSGCIHILDSDMISLDPQTSILDMKTSQFPVCLVAPSRCCLIFLEEVFFGTEREPHSIQLAETLQKENCDMCGCCVSVCVVVDSDYSNLNPLHLCEKCRSTFEGKMR